MDIKDREIKIVIRAFEEIIEDSDVIADIKNDLFDVEQRQKDNYSYTMDHIDDKVNDLHYDIQDDLDSFQHQIDELKDAIENLKEKANG